MTDKGRKTMLIFDLDGTLFKTRDAVVPAVKETLDELGIPSIGEDKIISLLGESTSIFSEKVMEGHEDKLDHFMDIFWRREKENVDKHGELFDGTEEMLEKLRSSGYSLAVCSNGSQEYVDYVLEVTGISDYFDLKVSSSQHDNKGEAVKEIIQENDHSDYIMIGDKHHDFEAGKENNILSIGVKYGYGKMEELKQADYLVESPDEIPEVVSRLDELLTTL